MADAEEEARSSILPVGPEQQGKVLMAVQAPVPVDMFPEEAVGQGPREVTLLVPVVEPGVMEVLVYQLL
jgi:hypothetical protein